MKEFFKRLLGIKNPTRYYVSDVKPGDDVKIEWSRVKGGIGTLKCLNNDPLTKKILLQVHWANYKEGNTLEFEKIILDYNAKELKNFHLLNSTASQDNNKFDDQETDIAELQKKINEAIENEQYELAESLQKKVDKLLKK